MITYYNKIEFNFDFDQDSFYFSKIIPHENVEYAKMFHFSNDDLFYTWIHFKMLNVVFDLGWVCPDKGW
jgi:hypothetical protein